jgi:3D (Asp-Asp-Asp) domain-containing protein
MLARPIKAWWPVLALAFLVCTAVASSETVPSSDCRIDVSVDGRTLSATTNPGRTVTDVLQDMGVRLGPNDRVKPGAGHAVFDGLCVSILRVTVSEEQSTTNVPYTVDVREDRELRKGLVKLEPGTWQDGVGRQTIRRYTHSDGVVEEYVTAEAAATPMRPKVITIGTKGASPSRASSLPGRLVEFSATAYAPNSPACGSTGTTSIGLPAGRGVVAVDPSVVPYGTKMWIDGYGWAVAGDTGSAIKGHRVDVCYDDYSTACRYGTREVVVRLFE